MHTIVNRSKFFVIAISVGILTSCGDSGKDSETQQVQVVDTTIAVVETEEVTYNLPSPLQIVRMFKRSGLKYIDGLTSDQKDPAKYTSKVSMAVNMGVYSTDLAYNVINKKEQQGLIYMKLSKQIADNLGLRSSFDEGDILKRFEKNLGNEDSLTQIIGELQMSIETYLQDNDQQEVSSIAFSGAWIESMYIGVKVFEKGKDPNLSFKISEQMLILDQILNALNNDKGRDIGIEGLIIDLNTIKTVYNSFDSVKNFKVSEEGMTEVINLTDKEIETLSKTIVEVRTKFVKG